MSPSPNGRPTFGTLRLEVDRAGGGKETYTQDIHSYLDNWYGVMRLIMHDNTSVTLTDTTGAGQTFRTSQNNSPWAGSSLEVQIQIGADGSSFSQSDSNLGGTFGTSNVGSSTRENANRLVRHSASFAISSGNTIGETGIRWSGLQDTNSNNHDIQWERTVLGTPVSVSNGDTVSVTYEHTWGAP